MERAKIPLAVGLILGCIFVQISTSQGSSLNDTSIETRTILDQLAKLSDFSKFKQIFNKSYATLQEEQARAKIFLGRALKMFVSVVSFMHHKASSYLAINQMSDWTKEELKRIKMKARIGTKTKPKRSPSNEMRPAQETDEPVGLGDELEWSDRKLIGQLSRRSESVPLSLIGSLLGWLHDKLVGQWKEPGPEGLLLDHRSSGCISDARAQGKCGSCYAFAVVSLYEWTHCRDTGKLVSFSEQYLIDCGERSQLEGCEGGYLDHALFFGDHFGLEPLDSWPYKEKKEFCPFPRSRNPKRMGRVRVASVGSSEVSLDALDGELEKSPLLVGLMVSDQFDFYGGGLDQNLNCVTEDLDNIHAMLLVGRGIHEGNEFYLLKNSYSTNWGLGGYWKVSRQAFDDCLSDEVAYRSWATFKDTPESNLNPLYVPPLGA